MSEFVYLGELAKIQKGRAPLVVGYTGPDAIPYLNPEYLRGKSTAELAKAGVDSVITKEGESILLWDGSNAGELFRARRGIVASTMARIIPLAGLEPKYFFHALKHAETHLKAQANGTGIPHVDREVLEKIRVFKPEGKEQQGIACILDTLDTAIRETEAIITKLKAVKQGLLHDLLTRGIDSNGELRPPQTEAPHLYKQSPLGWIPKEWRCAQIRELGEVVTGGTPPSSDNKAWGDGLPFVTPGDLTDEGLSGVLERQVSPHGLRYIRQLPAGTTLVVCIGSTIGKVGYASFGCCTNQQINAVIPSSDADPKFMHLALERCTAQLRGLAGLQAVPIVNKSSFEKILIPAPGKGEQVEISLRVLALLDRLRRESNHVGSLSAMKIGLMDDLLTGRVRVNPLLTAEQKTQTRSA